MPDTTQMIARDLVAEVGRGPALGYLVGQLLSAQRCRAARQVVWLLAAVIADGWPVFAVQGGASS